MTHDQIHHEVRAALLDLFEIEASRVTLEATLRDDLDLDSIDAIDLAVKLQSLVGHRVEMSVLRELRTVGDVVDLIARERTLASAS